VEAGCGKRFVRKLSAMAVLRRSAAPGSVEVISEDLRLAREAGGLGEATAEQLQGTLAMLNAAAAEDVETALSAARAVLATHVRQTCEALYAAATDVCNRASAASLAASLIRDGGHQKLASIRRTALADAGCHLTLDGLRKREDGLIQRIAIAVHGDLLERQRERGWRTVEEAVRHSGELIETVHDELHDGLPLLYALAPSTDERLRRGFMWQALVGVAAAMVHLRQIVRLHAGPGPHSGVDYLFADIAQHAMLVTFPDGDDKQLAHDILTSLERWDVEAFIPAIKAHPEGDAFLDRWGAWLTSCHPTCAYQRADVVRLCCRPHQLTVALGEFAVNYRELLTGELAAFVAEEMPSA
jgi:hypothetical protein